MLSEMTSYLILRDTEELKKGLFYAYAYVKIIDGVLGWLDLYQTIPRCNFPHNDYIAIGNYNELEMQTLRTCIDNYFLWSELGPLQEYMQNRYGLSVFYHKETKLPLNPDKCKLPYSRLVNQISIDTDNKLYFGLACSVRVMPDIYISPIF